jgi:RNA polymerase sigma-70 factor (ECF subfamily)
MLVSLRLNLACLTKYANKQYLMETTKLIKACLKGNPQAQRELYEHYMPYVLTVVRRFGVYEAEHPDLIQEIFVAVFQGLDRFDANKGDLHHWIRGLSVNKIVAHQKKRRRFSAEELSSAEESKLKVQIDLQHLDAEYLLDLINQLPTGYRTVFNLYVVDGYAHEEIAKMLNISTVGSRSQLSRAKSLLRGMLGSLKIKTIYGAF